MKKANTIAKLKKDLDKVFNKFIRERDLNPDLTFDCISCGENKPIGLMHAGHFYASTFTAVRWHEQNVNGQCVGCNTFKHGNLLEYRKGMIKKYGQGVVDRLEEIHNETVKLDRFTLEFMIDKYKGLLKEMK